MQVKFNGKDFKIKNAKVIDWTIDYPNKKKNIYDSTALDSQLDFTNTIIKRDRFTDRIITLEILITETNVGAAENKRSEILKFFRAVGKQELELSIFPSWHFMAEVRNDVGSSHLGFGNERLAVRFDCNPYRYGGTALCVPWDTFVFDTDDMQMLRWDISAIESEVVKEVFTQHTSIGNFIIDEGMQGQMQVTVNGEWSAVLNVGDNKFNNIPLIDGWNKFVFTGGTGKVSFDYERREI